MYQTIQILVINFLLNFEKGWLENEIEDIFLEKLFPFWSVTIIWNN